MAGYVSCVVHYSCRCTAFCHYIIPVLLLFPIVLLTTITILLSHPFCCFTISCCHAMFSSSCRFLRSPLVLSAHFSCRCASSYCWVSKIIFKIIFNKMWSDLFVVLIIFDPFIFRNHVFIILRLSLRVQLKTRSSSSLTLQQRTPCNIDLSARARLKTYPYSSCIAVVDWESRCIFLIVD